MWNRSILTLLAMASTMAAADAPRMGPPTICVPLEIGKAKCLPFGKGAMQPDPEYRIDRDLVRDTLRILGQSKSAEVHFETLRRAALYLRSESHAERARLASATKIASELHVALRTRVLDVASQRDSTPRSRALAWFDLGLYELDMKILGLPQPGRIWSFLEKAGRLLPDDPGLSLTLFAAGFSERKEAWWKPHLGRVIASREELGETTRKNLEVMAKRFLGVKDLEDLQRRYGPAAGAGKR